MLKNKITIQTKHWDFIDIWDTITLSSNDLSFFLQKKYKNFIKISVKYNKTLNKNLHLRYWIDRIEQNKCIIVDYNKKVILLSFQQELEFDCSELGNKIFHHASFINAWLEELLTLLYLACIQWVSNGRVQTASGSSSFIKGKLMICQALFTFIFQPRRLIFIN